MNARKVGRRGLAAAGLATVGVLAASGVAYAYWSAQATGVPLYASADSVNAGSKPTATADGTSVNLSWTAVTTQGGRAVSGYVLKRYDAPSGGNLVSVAQGTCASTVAALTCTETNVADGTWYYTSTPVLSAWLGAESARSVGVTVVRDAVAPTVSSIARAGSSPTNGASVSWTVTFSEPVTGVDVTDFVLAATGLSGASISSVTPVTSSTYTVTAGTGANSGTLGLNLVDNDSIVDLAANKLGGTGAGNGNHTGSVYAVDKQPPTAGVSLSGAAQTNGSTLSWTVLFNDSVTGVDATDFAYGATGTVATTGLSVTANSGTSYTVSANSVTGDGTLALSLADDDSIADTAGNKLGGTGTGNGNVAGGAYTVDHTVPTVTSVNRTATSPSNAATVTWLVTFSEGVTGVNAGDFALAATGTATGGTPSVAQVDSSHYNVSVGSVAGTGNLGLNVADDDSITDSSGNKLGGTGTSGAGNGSFTGQTYGVDRDAPTAAVTRTAAATTNGSTVSWTVAFGESVTGIDTGDFGLTLGGTAAGTITSVSAASGSSVTVTATGVAGNGTIGLNVKDDDSIKDAIGNPLGGTGLNNGASTNQQPYTSDRIAPVANDISSANKAGGTAGKMEAGDSVTFVFTDVNGMSTGSIASGWTGSSPLNVVVRATNGGSNNDSIAIYDAGDSTQLNLGTVDLGSAAYLSATTTFGATGTPSTLTYTGTGTFLLTFGAVGSTGAIGSDNKSRLTWAPSVSATDLAGNAASPASSQSGNVSQF